ncbi:hypothetical protein [Phenylobacterium sp.]|uniref:hypothetical protein n=1 Tax=Phenylobacterium sp. TaxID=1871053 RepID=UPI0027359BB3|nr:hypothetical protein [Phenylobacterium sp.]MDP3853144.1 hypothetical protein [Phenylobacterium sp.]
MRHRIRGLVALAAMLSVALVPPTWAAERSVGETAPAKTYVEVVSVDPLTGEYAPGAGGGGGGATTIADGGDVAQGDRDDAAWSGTGSGTSIAVQKAIRNLLAGTLLVGDGSGAFTVDGTVAVTSTPLSNLDTDIGAPGSSSCGTDAGTCDAIALDKRRNERLTTLIGHADGLEGQLTTLDGRVDGLEGFLDGVETAIASTNTKLDTLDGRVDGLETLVTSSNTKLDAAIAELVAIKTATDPVTTQPRAATTTDASSTVTTGGTFQTVFASSASRLGCFIQNPITASETLFVYEGTGTATTAKSINLAPGAAFNCNAGGIVVTGLVQVTAATTAHAFVAKSQ